jgi:hypothetical protein
MKLRESHAVPAGVLLLRLALAAGMAAVAVTSVSCSMFRAVNPLSTTMNLHNASGRTVLVVNKEVAPGKKINVDYVTGSGDRLFVFSAGCVFSFTNLPELPDRFESGSLFGSEYHAQLEGDGRIFLVLPGVRRPVDAAAHAVQPAGFPLTPSRGSGCRTEETPPAADTPPTAPSTPAASPEAPAPAGADSKP